MKRINDIGLTVFNCTQLGSQNGEYYRNDGYSSNPDILPIVVQSSKLSCVLPNKNPTAHGKGLSSDSASAVATALPDCMHNLLSNPISVYMASA